ncbi:MAG: hypothetical protein H7Z13_06005 [Ferruginibacter sp.]|nr:hypothetical protein [Ferruginibacter sp.]
MNKATTYLLLFLCSFHYSKAQFYKSILPSEAFSDSLSVIVQDFKKNFATIEGMQLPSQGEMDVYRSKATIPGALHCSIYRFHSLQDTTASWQAILYEGDNYEQAVKIYKNTFRQLKKTKMKWVDKSIISFTGELEMPVENVRFAVTSLQLNIIDKPYRSFYGEIELTGSYDGWEVHLNLHNRKKDTEKY